MAERQPIIDSHVHLATEAWIEGSLGPYRKNLAPERRHLFDLFRVIDVGFKVVSRKRLTPGEVAEGAVYPLSVFRRYPPTGFPIIIYPIRLVGTKSASYADELA